MPEVQFVSQGDKRILVIDLANISDYALLPKLVEKAIHLAKADDVPASIRTLVDLSNTRINTQVIASLRTLSQTNGRYAKATSFVGLNKTWSLLLSMLLSARGKSNHRVIKIRHEAMSWLAQQ